MFKGKRVVLRPMLMEDVPLICDWFVKNELSVHYIGTALGSIEEVKVFFEENLKKPAIRKDFMILRKNDGFPIGMVSIENINWQTRSGTYVIFLGEHGERRKEYAWEAHVLCFDYAFDILNLHRIEMRMLSFNLPILRVAHEWDSLVHGENDASVYVHEGTLVDAAFFGGEYCNVEIYGILQDNYKCMQKKMHRVLDSLS